MENGALLSASELEKCGYFMNSLSDDVPVISNQIKIVAPVMMRLLSRFTAVTGKNP
jgi:hypothetical protein